MKYSRIEVAAPKKRILKKFIVLEIDTKMVATHQLGIHLSRCVNAWMRKGYTPLGAPFKENDVIYYSMVLKDE